MALSKMRKISLCYLGIPQEYIATLNPQFQVVLQGPCHYASVFDVDDVVTGFVSPGGMHVPDAGGSE